MLVICALIFAVFSCTPERRFTRFAKKHPALFDTVTTSDTVVIVDSVTIHTTNTIRETEIDSIIVDCPDAVKPKIREQIKNRCTIESILNGAHIFRLTNGTGVLTASGDDPHLHFETNEVRTETTVYLPNDCEKESQSMFWKGVAFGGAFLFLALCIIVLFRVVK